MIKLVKKNTKAVVGGIKTDENITLVPINSIVLWKDNPRKNEDAASKLAEVIKSRGQITPVVVWRKNMVAYKGNTTIKAMKLLGYKTVKVLFADFPSETAAIAYGIADNKASEWAEWDDSVLKKFFDSPEILKDSGFTEVEKRSLFFEPEQEKIDKINSANVGLKDKVVVVVLDAAKRDTFKEMLTQWIKSSGFTGIEVK